MVRMMEQAREQVPHGWCRDDAGILRRETVPSMLRRLAGWDYRQRAIYQITMTLADRASQALGCLEVMDVEGAWQPLERARVHGLPPQGLAARVRMTQLGAAVAQCWQAIPRFYPAVKILGTCVMPDHFHGILFVTEPLDCHLGQVIKGFKTGCNKAARGVLYSPTLSASTGHPLRQSASTGHATGLFAQGFQDTVLLHEGQLANMMRYLADNPRRLAIKRLAPQLFRTVDELRLPLHLAENDVVAGRFSALGNRYLLDRPLVQVQVSRRDFGYRRLPKPGGGTKIARDGQGVPLVAVATEVFAEKKEAYLAAAQHGAVLISPCISEGEREVARLALAAGLPLVTLHNRGFSRLEKPPGRYFEACAAGRLLMLAPAAWPYQPGAKVMTRADATALNRLCQWLVGADAAEINYHGMSPGNVDALARAAACVEAS